MSREIINLLPPDRVRRFRREYFLRVATVAFLLLTLLVVIHGIFLLPSYFYASAEARSQQSLLAEEGSTTPAESDAGAALASLKNDAQYLTRLSAQPSATGAVRAALSVPHPGITLASMSYTPPANGSPATAKMTLTGTAATREALRAYDLALAGAPFVSQADLPVSVYAKETDIDFTLTLTGTLAAP